MNSNKQLATVLSVIILVGTVAFVPTQYLGAHSTQVVTVQPYSPGMSQVTPELPQDQVRDLSHD